MAAGIIKVAALAALAAALSAQLASAKPIVAPNDRAGAQGVGQTSTDPIGMGGQYGQNLIQNAQAAKKRDLQNARSFRLPTSPDRPGTSSVDAAQFSGSTVRPDDRSGTRGVQPSTGNPTYDVGGVLVNPNSAPTPTAVAAPVSSIGDGFNWGSAGIGAAGFAALALAIALLTVVMRRGRNTDVAVS